MPYRTEVEKALDELVAEEAGMKFQGLAVVLAKQKWPRLVASNRKWDLGQCEKKNADYQRDYNRRFLSVEALQCRGKSGRA
jgi:hypothetical protein